VYCGRLEPQVIVVEVERVHAGLGGV